MSEQPHESLFGQLESARERATLDAIRGLLVAAGGISLFVTVGQLTFDEVSPVGTVALFLMGGGALAAGLLAWLGQTRPGLNLLLSTAMLSIFVAQLEPLFNEVPAFTKPYARIEVSVAALACAAFLTPRRTMLLMAALAMLGPVAKTVVAGLTEQPSLTDLAGGTMISITGMAIVVLVAEFINGQERQSRRTLANHVHQLEEVVVRTRTMARGDLQPFGDVDGGLLAEVEQLRVAYSGSIKAVRSLTQAVARAADDLQASASSQAAGAAQQAAAVAEARATVTEISTGATEIGAKASEADARIRSTDTQTRQLSASLDTLLKHATAVGKLLEDVRSISAKSQLLALNASLEGVRAGQAGRGFALVAEQMQQLSDRVSEMVDRLQTLNEAMTVSSRSAAEAMATTRVEVGAAADLAAEIRRRTDSQEIAMSQTDRTVGEIAEVTHQVATTSSDVQRQVAALAEMVRDIDEDLGRFKV